SLPRAPSLTFLSASPPGTPALHPFPTRRSSDLPIQDPRDGADRDLRALSHLANGGLVLRLRQAPPTKAGTGPDASPRDRKLWVRSEEHTSELQSRENLVCRLLLEKKKRRTHDDG